MGGLYNEKSVAAFHEANKVSLNRLITNGQTRTRTDFTSSEMRSLKENAVASDLLRARLANSRHLNKQSIVKVENLLKQYEE